MVPNREFMWVFQPTHALASYTACIIKSRIYHERRTIGYLNEIYFQGSFYPVNLR